MEKPSNPANSAAAPKRAPRVPMSVPRRKLQVPEIPGYHCHWFLEANVPSALQGYYEFVKSDEISLNQFGVATNTSISGNQDMGSNVCIIGNRQGANGKPEMQYLMKLKDEWYGEDQKLIGQANAQKLSAIFRGEQIAGAEQAASEDRGLSYVDHNRTRIERPLFMRPTRKGKG